MRMKRVQIGFAFVALLAAALTLAADVQLDG